MVATSEVRLNTEGATLYALDQGEGPALLFFHGGMADHRAALGLVGSLTDRLRLITPDLRGAGRSWWAGPLDWERLAEDAVAMTQHLGLDRVVVGGVSMGSAVALTVALRHPERVAALALVHPVYPGTERGLPEAVRAAMEALDALGRRAPTEGIGVFYPLFDALPEAIRDRARAMLDGFDPASVAATTRLLGSGRQPFDRLDALAAVRCPTVIVPGRDPQHPAEVAARLAEGLPHARLIEADEASLPGLIAALCLEAAGAAG